MKNNNKGLIATISILSIIILSLIVYIFYTKSECQKENLENNTITNNNEQLQNNNKNEIENTITIANIFEKFYGKWEYSYEYEDLDCEQYYKLDLKEDGTFTYSYGATTCAGAWDAKGKYAISKNKIYLYNDNCKIIEINDECNYGNCSHLIELNYTEKDGEISITTGTEKTITLEKK